MKMLRRSGFIVVLIAVFIISTLSAHAALELRGTDSQGNRLIYDTDLNITWYDYTNSSDTWQNQMNWASALSVSGGDLVGVYDDWRLHSRYISGEMIHLYYTELGNVRYPRPGYGLRNTGDFQNLKENYYWSGTEDDLDHAWAFNTGVGEQDVYEKYNTLYAIAVRPGDVSVAVVPEPVSMILFGVGGVVLGARRLVKRRRG